jgi:type IV pili sensor histidine kinase/response regulator
MHTRPILALSLAGLLLTAACPSVQAESGYALVNPVATAEQDDILAVVVSLKFPSHVATVGDAITLLLERSGYRLAFGSTTDPELPTLLGLPLPQVHRNLSQIRLRDALQALAGSAWMLVEDPVNRLVSFDLDDRYRAPPALKGGV